MSGEKTDFTGLSADEAAAAGGALWLGPGKLFRDLAPVLEVLASADSRRSIEALGDLDRLLDRPPSAGLLLLDADELPGEDVGLVRRFLRRHGGWSLVLCGSDPSHRTARALSGERSRWMAWPPDLDQLRQLAGSAPDSIAGPLSGNGTPSSASPTGARRGGGRGFDLGELVEERIAAAALRGDEPPEYSYRAEGDLSLALAREDVGRVVDGLLSLARSCGGAGSAVSVAAESSKRGDHLELGVSFPEGPLRGLDPARVLDAAALAKRLGSEESSAVEDASAALSALGGSARAQRRSGNLEVRLSLPRGD